MKQAFDSQTEPDPVPVCDQLAPCPPRHNIPSHSLADTLCIRMPQLVAVALVMPLIAQNANKLAHPYTTMTSYMGNCPVVNLSHGGAAYTNPSCQPRTE